MCGLRRWAREFVYLNLPVVFLFFFFFQAEDGIRDVAVTGVQTCALPISLMSWGASSQALCKLLGDDAPHDISATACRERYNQRDLPVWPGRMNQAGSDQIGRASCRERV